MTKKKPKRLGWSCLLSDSAPDNVDRASAHRPLRPQRAPRQSPCFKTSRPSPPSSFLALLASFIIPTITPAHAAPSSVSSNALRTHPSPDAIQNPIYLDFLYPPPCPQRQQPPQGPSHALADHPVPPRRPRRKARAATSGTTHCNCVIPLKFEKNDLGWMIAEEWTLHGKTRSNPVSGTIPPSSNPPNGLDGVSSLDSTNIYLDLPTGWNSTATSRHVTYDPVIVTVFAFILACGIAGAIAAAVWRKQHLRAKKLREDLERATKPKHQRRADSDSDAGIEEEGPREETKKKRRRRKVAGSGGAVAAGAGKSSSTFWRPSPRFVGRLRSRSRRHKSAEASTTDPPVVSPRPASPQPDPPREDLAPNPPVILVSTEPELGSHTRTHLQHRSDANLPLSPPVNHDSNASLQPEPERIPASSVFTALPLPVSSIHSVDQGQSMPNFEVATAPKLSPTIEGYTSSPPAYIRVGRGWTPRRAEKAPLPGLEAEYDDRELEQWRASRLTAGSTSTIARPTSIALSAVESELGVQPPPSVMSRVTGVHIATDDKAELARLRSLADRPDAPLLPDETFHVPDAPAPTVPDFGVVDDWYTEAQLEQVSSPERNQPSSSTLPVLALNRLALPPPPEPYLLTRGSLRHDPPGHSMNYHDTHDINEVYTFRQVWGGITSSPGPSAPSIAVEEDGGLVREENLEGLVPSAPPPPNELISNAHLPSAPALWDEENGPSEPPREASSGSSPGERSESPSSSLVEADANTDVNTDVDVRVRWVQQRQVEREGAGLPKYEP